MTVAAGVVTRIDERPKGLDINPTWELEVVFTLVAADTAGIAAVPINGLLQKIVYKRSDMATNNDLTSELALSDNGDNEIFTTGGGLAEALTTQYSVNEPLVSEVNIDITLNEAAGEAGVLTVTLRGV